MAKRLGALWRERRDGGDALVLPRLVLKPARKTTLIAHRMLLPAVGTCGPGETPSRSPGDGALRGVRLPARRGRGPSRPLGLVVERRRRPVPLLRAVRVDGAARIRSRISPAELAPARSSFRSACRSVTPSALRAIGSGQAELELPEAWARVRLRVQARLRPLQIAAFRCNVGCSELQALSVSSELPDDLRICVRWFDSTRGHSSESSDY
jgi:hypothetical protein